MGSINVGLLSNHNTSSGPMLLSVKVSHWMFLGFPSSDELDRGMCMMVKCYNNLVASQTRWMYAAMTSSFASYAPLSWLAMS